MTNAQTKIIEIPFPTQDALLTTITPVLSEAGIFIETQFPPAVGTHLEMVFLVGPNKQEVARFRAEVKAQEPDDPTLIAKKGVQLTFIELLPNAKELFGMVFKNASKEATSESSNSTQSLSESEIKNHLAEQSATVELSPDEVNQQKNKSDQLKSLADDLTDFTKRPIGGKITKDSSTNPSKDVQEFAADDFSSIQGAYSYEASDIILGIDLGTCNSCVAVVQNGKAKVLNDEQGNSTTPSVVSYLEDGSIIVGKEGVTQMAKNPKTSIFGAKRFVGRNYHSPVVQKMLRFFPYKVVPDEKNRTSIDIFGKSISLESVSSEILKYMVSIAQNSLQQDLNKVIVTVPAYYNDNQRTAVKEAGALAGLHVVRIINEPTAAALAVGFNQKMQKRLLIYDFGGGTFDVSILEIKDNSFQVIATGGDNFLGGEDFDNRLVKWVLESSREEGILLARNAVTFERLKQACERGKRELSTKRDTGINLPYIQTTDNQTINFQKMIDRQRLVNLTRDLVQRSLKLTDQVMADAKLNIKDLDEVILVGGMTRMPFIRNSVHQHFSKKPYGDVNPDEAVAVGAALLGGEMTGSKKVSLVDALSMSIGIALPRNRFKPILFKNSQVPCQKQYKIAADLSSEFTIDVFQGESKKCSDNEYLGTLVFSDKVKGGNSQSLEIEFALTNECLLNCTIRNPASGKSEKALLITHDTPPSTKLV